MRMWMKILHGWLKDWRSENVNAIKLNCKVVKKVRSPLTTHFCINSPFSGLSPFSSKKFCHPQVNQFLEGAASPFNKGVGVEGRVFQLCIIFKLICSSLKKKESTGIFWQTIWILCCSKHCHKLLVKVNFLMECSWQPKTVNFYL